MHGLEPRYADKINFVYLDRDDPEVKPLMRQLNNRGMPHLILLDAAGNPIKQWAGGASQESLVEALDAVLAGEPIP